jgi:putative DNA primase/helicase
MLHSTTSWCFRQPFDFENTAKLIFSTYDIPETVDDSYVYFSRWVIMPFNHTFEGENKDVNLLEKLTRDAVLSGLLIWALAMLRQLEMEGGFQHSDINEVKKQYQLGAGKIHEFIG